jgi:hypothetical protein
VAAIRTHATLNTIMRWSTAPASRSARRLSEGVVSMRRARRDRSSAVTYCCS